jgi:hypothetical protein
LRPDTLPADRTRRSRDHHVGKHQDIHPRPQRQKLAAIVLLSRHAGDRVAIERLRGARSIIELQGVVHMPEAARALGLDPAIFNALTRLASLGVTVWQLAMPDDRACLDEAAAQILAVLPDG